MLPTTAEVLRGMDALESCFFNFSSDVFGLTWQVSHLRLVESIKNSQLITDAEVLASILSKSPAGSFDIYDWLPKSFILPSTQQDLRQHIDHALHDIQECFHYGGGENNQVLFETLQKITVEDAEKIAVLSSSSERVLSVNAYKYGPTYQMFWHSKGKMYFLEIHNES